MKTRVLVLCLLLLRLILFAQTDSSFTETPITLETKTGKIYGTLCTPKRFDKIPVALIIAGSGPTDRDGNSAIGLQSDAYKLLAHKLSANNIATVRYDKRGIGESKDTALKEKNVRFETFINDAADWLAMLKKDKRFSKIIIIGHSEGSLIGMVAAQSNTDKYVSLAGIGQSADKTLKIQLGSLPQMMKDTAYWILDSLAAGKTVSHVGITLYSLFRPSIQPYLISWFKYDPSVEIKKLKIPVLILEGTNDLQVRVEDAKLLKAADTSAKMVLLDGMNHVLKKVGDDKNANIKSYKDPTIPIDEELVTGIAAFIKGK